MKNITRKFNLVLSLCISNPLVQGMGVKFKARSLMLFVVFYAYRLLNAFAVTTLLFPDEWWQFSEPAHAVVYNFGYLTWDWRVGIRSYLTILPLIFLLKVSKFFQFGEDWMVRHGSKFVMAGWMALTDLYTVKLAGRFFGPSIKPYAVRRLSVNH